MKQRAKVEREVPERARRLLEKWQRLARSHIPLGGGCSCGGGGVGSLSLRELEQDVLDYLATKHAADHPDVGALLRDAAGYRQGETGSIAGLLSALAQAPPAGWERDRLVLGDLEKSIDSIAHLHHDAGPF
jgi:hypothetical protein